MIHISSLFSQNQYQNAFRIPSARTTRLATTRNASIPALSIPVASTAVATFNCTELFASATKASQAILNSTVARVRFPNIIEILCSFLCFIYYPYKLFSSAVGCRGDSECPLTQSCINNECVDACSVTQCGINAFCRSDAYHRPRCYCPDGYIGNPYQSCERPACINDNDCSSQLVCRDSKCVSPCDCPPLAQCFVVNHRATCRCPPGYVGDPYSSCLMGNYTFILAIFREKIYATSLVHFRTNRTTATVSSRWRLSQ